MWPRLAATTGTTSVGGAASASSPTTASIAAAASIPRIEPVPTTPAAAAAAAASVSAARRRCSATKAAPSAIESFESASTVIGRSVASPTISATSGIRDDPPMSRMRSSPWNVKPALSVTRANAPIVSAMWGRIRSSKSSRVSGSSVWKPGRSTWTVVSGSDDSASLARRPSSRSRTRAAAVAGSSASTAMPFALTKPTTLLENASSKSIPPRCSISSEVPISSKPVSVLRRIAASNVPPPKS